MFTLRPVRRVLVLDKESDQVWGVEMRGEVVREDCRWEGL
jgi:hypothetical protein